MYNQYFDLLNGVDVDQRINALEKLRSFVDEGKITYSPSKGYVNNHIHTTYSFSPYSPTSAVWEAKKAGLLTAGIVDHDAINGAEEFIQAGKILDMETTVGIECRISMANTPFNDKRLNNTDQLGIAYVAIHGIPHQQLDAVEAFIKPFREKRNLRNKKMVDKINGLFGEGFMDYEKDLVPLSMSHDGGSITERHLMFALAKKMIFTYGKGLSLVEALENEWDIILNEQMKNRFSDLENPYYEYDLLGLLKGAFVGKVYIEATDECPDIQVLVDFAHKIGAIPAYAYLGDVKNSVTGDKADMLFEDEYLDDLMSYLRKIGFEAITYMPSRNTYEQLSRLRNLCEVNGFFQISGEDINSPRQSFICEALLNPEYKNLITSTWAMIGHEKEASKNIKEGMFSEDVLQRLPKLQDRIDYFASKGIERTI